MILAWNAVPVGPLCQNGPPHHCQEKEVGEADSVTEGN